MNQLPWIGIKSEVGFSNKCKVCISIKEVL